MKIAITGSSGLIGSALVTALHRAGEEVIRLVPRAPRSADEVSWDPLAPRGGTDPAAPRGGGRLGNPAGAAREAAAAAPGGPAFVPGVGKDWGPAAAPARQAGVRVITLRSGIVMARK